MGFHKNGTDVKYVQRTYIRDAYDLYIKLPLHNNVTFGEERGICTTLEA